jgi:putative spermidine/putrescine transport system permease protein
MAAISLDADHKARSRSPFQANPVALSRRLMPLALLSPALIFLAMFFALPALGLISYSVLTQAADGTIGLPLTLDHYRHFFTTPLYARVLLTTLKISLVTTISAVPLTIEPQPV